MDWHQKIVSWFYRANYEKIKKKIMEAEVISFDVYNTMIRRNVMSPEDIFELVRIEFKTLTGRNIGNYKEVRCKSEHIARKESNTEEIRMNQIFENMEGFSEKEKETLKELEIQYELKMSCPNEKVIELYKFSLKNKKRIIITSDMYLEEKILKAILDKNGIKEYEKLYLSSTYGKNKCKGSLYKYVLKDLHIKPERVLHIGDSIQSDIIQAQKNGIKTCLAPRYFYNLKYWGKCRNIDRDDKVQYSVLKAFLQNNIYDEYIKDKGNVAKRIGFEVLGPILAGYSVWINEEIKRNKIDKIFFLAREGKILQRAYNILYRENAIPQGYLYVSRRAAIIPLISSARSFDEFVDIIKIMIKTPELRTVRSICSLDENEYKDKLRTIGLTEEASLYEIKNKEQFFEVVQGMIYEKAKRQKEYFVRYLKQESFSGNVLISDSGWSGTIQQIIQNLLIDDDYLHIKGAYIGVRNIQSQDKYKDLDREGYLFTPFKNRNFDYMTRFTNEILEKLLSNEENSTIGYEDRGKIEPIHAKKTFNDMSILFVQNIQDEALRFVEKFSDNLEIFSKINIKPEIIFNGYVNFAVYPSRNTVKIFSDFNSKYEMQNPIIPDKSIFYYMLHMKKLKQDLSAYCSIFLLKKIFILPLPYYEIAKFMIEKIGMRSDYRKNCENGFGQ